MDYTAYDVNGDEVYSDEGVVCFRKLKERTFSSIKACWPQDRHAGHARQIFNRAAHVWFTHFDTNHPLRHPKFEYHLNGQDYFDSFTKDGITFRFDEVPRNHAMANIMFLRIIVWYMNDFHRYYSIKDTDEEILFKTLVIAFGGGSSVSGWVPGDDMWFKPYHSNYDLWALVSAINVELGGVKVEIENPHEDEYLKYGKAGYRGVNDIKYKFPFAVNKTLSLGYQYGYFANFGAKCDFFREMIKRQNEGQHPRKWPVIQKVDTLIFENGYAEGVE